jgi:protein-tyrosine phosphatase
MSPSKPVFPNTFNSRAVTGTTAAGQLVRSGALFRSDAPTALGPAGRAAMRAAGIRTALDLREHSERTLAPADLDGLGLDTRHVPLVGSRVDVDFEMALDEIYRELLTQRGCKFAAAVRVLAEPHTLPALVFCSAGKDRTGLVVALALGAAGVLPEDIAADYELTERAMSKRFRAVVEARASGAGISGQQVAVTLGASARVMRRVLAWLEKTAGGAAEYLRKHGLVDEELRQLERGLIAPAGDADSNSDDPSRIRAAP